MRLLILLAAAMTGQGPDAPALPTLPAEPAAIGTSRLGPARADAAPAPTPAEGAPGVRLAQFLDEAAAGPPPTIAAPSFPTFPAAPPVATAYPAGTFSGFVDPPRGLFQSDRAFDGFVGPVTDPIQAKDPRSLTEARLLVLNNWGKPGTPVLGNGSYQVYALQLRLALTERLQLFADKDGIVRFSPNPGKSVTGLANIAAGAKYVFIRDVENQFLFSGAVQYEAPTGYANIYQNQGSGLLGVYGILGKEFGDNWHLLAQFGQNIAMQNQQNGYFYTHLHLDKRFGPFVPLVEFNWFYYNQSANYLPSTIGMEGGGLINLGTAGFTGNNLVTTAAGFKLDLGENLELGVVYHFPLTERLMLYGNQVIAELIFRY